MGRKPKTFYGQEPRDASIGIRMNSELKRNLEKVAFMKRTTLTDILNDLLKDFVRGHFDDLERYDEVFGDKEA